MARKVFISFRYSDGHLYKEELVKNTDGDWIVNDDSELQYLVMGGDIKN